MYVNQAYIICNISLFRLLKQLIVAQNTHIASVTILPNGITNIADAVHINVHTATTLVDVNAFEKLATRNAPVDIIWIILNAGVDAGKMYLAAKAVTAMDTITATAITPNILVTTTTRQRAATGAANTNIRASICDLGLI